MELFIGGLFSPVAALVFLIVGLAVVTSLELIQLSFNTVFPLILSAIAIIYLIGRGKK